MLSASALAELSHPNVRVVSTQRFTPPSMTHANDQASKLRMRLASQVTMLKGCASSIFYTPVTIGPQTFNLLIDTGSTTLAVASNQCDSSCAGLSPTYTPSASAQDQGQGLTSLYGSGGWNGRAFLDDVTVAGLPAFQMTFGAIDNSQNFFKTSNCPPTWNQANTYQVRAALLAVCPAEPN
jgi:hypothetical protein